MSKQSRDRTADVLILVDQYEPVFLAIAVRQFSFVFENPDRKRDQIGEIDALARGLFLFIKAKDSQELARGLLVQSGTDFGLPMVRIVDGQTAVCPTLPPTLAPPLAPQIPLVDRRRKR